MQDFGALGLHAGFGIIGLKAHRAWGLGFRARV